MRVARWLLLGLGGLVVAVALALGVWAVLPAATPPLEGPEPIAALERVVLGGAEQTLLVRGRDRGKPALLYVHGGPGFAQISIARHYSEELERHFVVVHWDQRGAGASCQGADFSALAGAARRGPRRAGRAAPRALRAHLSARPLVGQ